jgi:hypothetical protein
MRSLAGTVIAVALGACGGGAKATAEEPANRPRCVVGPDAVVEPLAPRPSGPDRAELESRIAALEAELAERAQVASEIVIALDGPMLTVQAAKAGEVRGIDDKTALVASKAFIDVVTGSRAAIQACYHKALVANTALSSRTVALAITASFTSGGAYQRSATSPSLGDTFDGCMKAVMTAWSMPGATSAMTFKAQIVLKP